jgi:hypothetical protein
MQVGYDIQECGRVEAEGRDAEMVDGRKAAMMG